MNEISGVWVDTGAWQPRDVTIEPVVKKREKMNVTTCFPESGGKRDSAVYTKALFVVDSAQDLARRPISLSRLPRSAPSEASSGIPDLARATSDYHVICARCCY